MKKIQNHILPAVLGLGILSSTGCIHIHFLKKERLTKLYEGTIEENHVVYYEKPFDKTKFGRIDLFDKDNKLREIMISGNDYLNNLQGNVDYYATNNIVYTPSYVIDSSGKTINGNGVLSGNILRLSQEKLSDATKKYLGLLKIIKENKLKEFD